jgi:drug/metabolite transporter (DMT)-like permease
MNALFAQDRIVEGPDGSALDPRSKPPDAARGKFPLLLFAVLLFLDVSSDLTQRAASGDVEADGIQYFVQLATNPWFILSLVIPLFQLLVWTRILAKVELSLASPLTSLNFPLTVWSSHLIFHESVDWRVWCGTLLITAGVMTLGANRE